MVLLDLLPFLLPFPIAYLALPTAMKAVGLPLSTEVHASFRNALALYAGLVLLTGASGAADITAFGSLLALIITGITVWEVFWHHRRNVMSWWLVAGNISLLAFVSVLIPMQLIPNSAAWLLLVWSINAGLTLGLAILWLAKSPLGERNKGRVLATAAYLLCLTVVAAALLNL